MSFFSWCVDYHPDLIRPNRGICFAGHALFSGIKWVLDWPRTACQQEQRRNVLGKETKISDFGMTRRPASQQPWYSSMQGIIFRGKAEKKSKMENEGPAHLTFHYHVQLYLNYFLVKRKLFKMLKKFCCILYFLINIYKRLWGFLWRDIEHHSQVLFYRCNNCIVSQIFGHFLCNND